MIREVTYYQAVCDRCGKADDQGEYTAWGDRESALTVALDDGCWQYLDAEGEDVGRCVSDGVTLLCTDCWTWDEDGERIIARPQEVST